MCSEGLVAKMAAPAFPLAVMCMLFVFHLAQGNYTAVPMLNDNWTAASSENVSKIGTKHLIAIDVCLLWDNESKNDGELEIADVVLVCRAVASDLEVTWFVETDNGTWEEAENRSCFEANGATLRLPWIDAKDSTYTLKCGSATHEIESRIVDFEQNLPIPCEENHHEIPTRSFHLVVYVWIALGIFIVCVCIVGGYYAVKWRKSFEVNAPCGQNEAVESARGETSVDDPVAAYSTPKSALNDDTASVTDAAPDVEEEQKHGEEVPRVKKFVGAGWTDERPYVNV